MFYFIYKCYWVNPPPLKFSVAEDGLKVFLWNRHMFNLNFHQLVKGWITLKLFKLYFDIKLNDRLEPCHYHQNLLIELYTLIKKI